MKKLAFRFLAAMLVFASITLFSGCTETLKNDQETSSSTNCSHSYVKTESTATCLRGGIATYRCSWCKDTYTKQENALGHTTSIGTCSRCGESFGSWEVAFYVDEFNNPTNNAYMRTSDVLSGTFSNSATTNSSLYARILIDSDGVTIKLWEYGRSEVKAYTTTNYKITFLDDNGNKSSTTGKMYENGDRIHLADWSIVTLLQKNSTIKVYIQENSKYGVNSNYLFEVPSENFNSVYSTFYEKYMN